MTANREPVVSVIIATLADGKRRACLLRAIDCILAQEGVAAVPVVVVNGQRFDVDLVADLKQRSDIVFHQEPVAGLSNARIVGRRRIVTPFFAFLDDDDEYLPHAISSRLIPLLADPTVDVVVSNGYRFDGKVRSVSAHNIADARERPLLSILDNNWLTSAGGLFRTGRFAPEFFSCDQGFGEWTYLAFKLGLEYRMVFVDDPSYVIHDTEGSMSKTSEYSEALAGVMERVLDLPLPVDAYRAVSRKYGAALHDLADHWLQSGQRGKALRYHLRSLLQAGGLGYLFFSRKFVGL